MGIMGKEIGSVAMAALVRRYDVEDPGFHVEWKRARDAAGVVEEPGAARRPRRDS